MIENCGGISFYSKVRLLFRFGPGLVIYWYGFVDELADEMRKNEIILMDHFPEDSEIVHFQPKSVETTKML